MPISEAFVIFCVIWGKVHWPLKVPKFVTNLMNPACFLIVKKLFFASPAFPMACDDCHQMPLILLLSWLSDPFLILSPFVQSLRAILCKFLLALMAQLKISFYVFRA